MKESTALLIFILVGFGFIAWFAWIFVHSDPIQEQLEYERKEEQDYDKRVAFLAMAIEFGLDGRTNGKTIQQLFNELKLNEDLYKKNKKKITELQTKYNKKWDK